MDLIAAAAGAAATAAAVALVSEWVGDANSSNDELASEISSNGELDFLVTSKSDCASFVWIQVNVRGLEVAQLCA